MYKKFYLYMVILLGFLSSSFCAKLEAKDGFVNNNGVQIHYTDHGSCDAIPIVFVHGFPLSGAMWICQVKELSQFVRVITIDLRGFGRSGKNANNYSYAALVSDVRAVITALDLERPVLAGHSLGSIVVEKYAVTYPNEISRLILFNPFAGRILNGDGYTFGLDPASLAPLIGLLPDRKAAFDRGFIGAGLPETCEERNKIYKFLLKVAAQTPADIELATLPTAASTGVTLNALATITVPTLIIFGTEDVINNREGIFELSRLLPNSLLRQFYGGHFINLTQSKSIDLTILMFLKEHPNKCHTCFCF